MPIQEPRRDGFCVKNCDWLQKGRTMESESVHFNVPTDAKRQVYNPQTIFKKTVIMVLMEVPLKSIATPCKVPYWCNWQKQTVC